MADILHNFLINAPVQKVFESVSTPAGLDAWWTKKSAGNPAAGEKYVLWFGPVYDWRAEVSKYIPGKEFELTLISADPDWLGTRVGFQMHEAKEGVKVNFYHNGWQETNEHYRISSYCWAMYLRLLKRYVENGVKVDYEDRLNV